MNYKKFEDYDDYIVFKTGKIFSLKKNIFLKPYLTKKGYHYVTFFKKGFKTRKVMIVHRLVALLFVPNPDNKLTVDHIGNNKRDNRLSNLGWFTMKGLNHNRLKKENHRLKTKIKTKKVIARQVINGEISIRVFKSKGEAIAYKKTRVLKLINE